MLELEQLAQRQLYDYDRHCPGTVFGEGLTISMADAYRLQSLVADLRVARGESLIGYKVGCTSPVIRQRLRAESPVFGRLFATECLTSGSSVLADQFDHLAIEGELAVSLSRDINAHETNAQITEAIEAVFPVVELHNLIFRGAGGPSPEELVANNAVHAGFVRAVGGPLRSKTTASLQIDVDDHLTVSVEGDELIDTIFRSLRWISSCLEMHGAYLRAGQTVLCGAVADLIPVTTGRIRVVTDHFGEVECCAI